MSRRSIEWWSSLMDRLTLVLTLSLYLPQWGTPTPLSTSDPASSGILGFPFGNLLPWLYYRCYPLLDYANQCLEGIQNILIQIWWWRWWSILLSCSTTSRPMTSASVVELCNRRHPTQSKL